VTPVHDPDGIIKSVSITVREITDRKRLERHQQLLIAELNHRVKNTLAIVQSLAHQTFTADKPPQEAIRAYEGRLSALAAAHNLLTRENWEAADLTDIVSGVLQPFCSENCTFHGPEVRVPPHVAVSLTLALHELATNAQKYGSLSTTSGSVDLTWDVIKDELTLQWAESGGPPVVIPKTTGFGTRMLQRALAMDLGGRVDVEYEKAGVVCRIRARLPNLQTESLTHVGT
jgi:two-component sensor histidine kinase